MPSRRTDSASGPVHAHSPRKDSRTLLLVRCSAEEAQLVREAAKAERRTVSGYILHTVFQRIRDQHGM